MIMRPLEYELVEFADDDLAEEEDTDEYYNLKNTTTTTTNNNNNEEEEENAFKIQNVKSISVVSLLASLIFASFQDIILCFCILKSVNVWFFCLPLILWRLFDVILCSRFMLHRLSFLLSSSSAVVVVDHYKALYYYTRANNSFMMIPSTIVVVVLLLVLMSIIYHMYLYPHFIYDKSQYYFKKFEPDYSIDKNELQNHHYRSLNHLLNICWYLSYVSGSARLIYGLSVLLSLTMIRPFHSMTDFVTQNNNKYTKSFLYCTKCLTCIWLALIIPGFVSFYSRVLSWAAPVVVQGDFCDPLDSHECLLPFPSSFYLIDDESTDTGKRVNVSEESLFRLKGNRRLDLGFLNNLDGFSTISPILFYIDGMKEAGGRGLNGSHLPDNSEIDSSITEMSVTLLIDITRQNLVPHYTEIDYLDPVNPLVIVQPAQALNHNTTYAVAVLNAVDVNGKLMPPVKELENLLQPENNSKRSLYFKNMLLPILKNTASWVDLNEKNLQLLFDFHTASIKSQVGWVFELRKQVLDSIQHEEPSIRLLQVKERDCAVGHLAKSFYFELKNIPWILDNGSGRIISELISQKFYNRERGSTKFTLHIPCSVEAIAEEHGYGVAVKSMVEWGHSMFYSRSESDLITFLHKVADNSSSVILASDWRGMCWYDLLTNIKMFLSDFSIFESVRDNIIQGFFNKLVIQHFAANKLILWLDNAYRGNKMVESTNSNSTYIFYGNSLGGILGAGYMIFSSPLKIIDKVLLGVAGTPLSVILPRSTYFMKFFSKLLLLNCYNYRQVRLLLSCLQMGWDSVEAGVYIANLIEEGQTLPRTLIQAGFGDDEVSTLATQILARTMNSVSVQNGNGGLQLFGIEEKENLQSSQVVLTQLYYEDEGYRLLMGNRHNLPPESNYIHHCVHRDPAMLNQFQHFVETGNISNPCLEDACIRQNAPKKC